MLRAITLLLVIVFASQANAATTYYTGKSGSDKNPCEVAVSGGANAKLTIAAGIACMTVGDTLIIQVGTYTETINLSTLTGGTASTPTTIQRDGTDVVTIRPSAQAIQGTYVTNDVHYITIDGFVFDGTGAGAKVYAIDIEGLPSHITIKNSEIKSWHGHAFFLAANNITLENNWIHDQVSSCIDGERWYGVYQPSGNNNIYSKNRFISNPGGGMQIYPSASSGLIVTRNTFKDNNTCSTSFNEAVLIHNSSGPVVANNIFDSNGKNGGGISSALRIGSSVSNAIVYNNSIYNHTNDGIIVYPSASGTVLRNNILRTNGNGGITNQGSGTTQSHNLCDFGCTGTGAQNGVNPLFSDAASGDLTLLPGSPAIDAGIASVAPLPAPLNGTYTSIGNGPLPDIGAFESIPFASASATTTSVLDITFGSAYAPLSTVSSCANVTVRQNLVEKTCSTFTNNGNATYRWTCAACLSAGGGTIDIAIAAGKFTDSINIGGSLNQANFALPVTTVANNIAGTTEVFTSRHFKQGTYGRAVTDMAWIRGEDLTGTVRVDGGKFANWWSIDCTVADCPSVGFQFEFSLNGAAYANVTDSCVTNAVCFDTTNSAAPHGTVIPTSLLTDALGNYLAGAVAAQASSYPVLDLALNQSTQIQLNGAIKSGLVAGTDQICIRPKLDSGAAISHAVTACFNVVNPAGSPA